MAGAVEANLLVAQAEAVERWLAVFMTLVRYHQPSLSWLVLVVRLVHLQQHILAASAGHHLLQAADLPCKRLVVAVGAVQMGMTMVEAVEEGQAPQEPEARGHQAMIRAGLAEAQPFKALPQEIA